MDHHHHLLRLLFGLIVGFATTGACGEEQRIAAPPAIGWFWRSKRREYRSTHAKRRVTVIAGCSSRQKLRCLMRRGGKSAFILPVRHGKWRTAARSLVRSRHKHPQQNQTPSLGCCRGSNHMRAVEF